MGGFDFSTTDSTSPVAMRRFPMVCISVSGLVPLRCRSKLGHLKNHDLKPAADIRKPVGAAEQREYGTGLAQGSGTAFR